MNESGMNIHADNKSLFTVLIFIYGLFLLSCRENVGEKYGNSPADTTVTYAQRFELHRNENYTILKISDPWQGAGNIVHEYLLVREGQKNDIRADPEKVIHVPVRKIICMSTTHVAMLEVLEQEKTIVAVSGAGLVYNEKISDRIKAGKIYDIGYDAGLNYELIIKSAPDLVMIYGIGSESAGFSARISSLGTKVIYNADYLETNPLGKAEWIKVFGALFCVEEKADSIFNEIAGSYNQLKEFISNMANSRPLVLLGMPFRDTWFISPGNSYISRMISDAGGTYLWERTESRVSMPYSLETVFVNAMKADIWLNTGSTASKREIISLDPRLGELPPFINDKLYNNNRRMNGSGGNDYWESGAVNPHIILKDIASIIHPEIFPEYEPVYYKKIE